MKKIQNMKKIQIITGMILVTLLLFAGCGGSTREEGQQPWLKCLEVYSNAANPENIYHVEYPYAFYAFTTDTEGGGITRRYDLQEHVKVEDLAEEDGGIQYFVEYVKGLPENQEGESLSYYVICRYIDEEGKEENIYRKGYGTFPEGWDGFIAQFNRICGGEFLSGGGAVQKVTPGFLTEAFGVTDEDVREGTLQDVIDTQRLDMIKVTGTFRIKNALDGYYASIKEPLLEPYRPRELISVESTQEEYDAFLESFFERLEGSRAEESESDQAYLRRFTLPDTGQSFYTAKTSDLDKLPTVKKNHDGYYGLELDAHMEGMTMGTDFIYSADGKFILVPMDCGTDVLTAFCQ